MTSAPLIMFEDAWGRISEIVAALVKDTKAKVAFLVDRNGQLIAAEGKTDNLDTTALASLTASNVAATGGLARLIREKEYSVLYHEGERDNLNIAAVGERALLVTIFDRMTSLEEVRRYGAKAVEELAEIMKSLEERASRNQPRFGGGGPSSAGEQGGGAGGAPARTHDHESWEK